MSENRQRQFTCALKSVLYPVLGVLPGFFHSFDWFPGMHLLLVVAGIALGAKNLSEALDSAPDVRPVALALYVPIIVSFLVGFCFLFAVFLQYFWCW